MCTGRFLLMQEEPLPPGAACGGQQRRRRTPKSMRRLYAAAERREGSTVERRAWALCCLLVGAFSTAAVARAAIRAETCGSSRGSACLAVRSCASVSVCVMCSVQRL